MSAHTPGPWNIGWGNGLTGPTTPSVSGPCVDGGLPFIPVHSGRDTIAIVPQQRSGVLADNARLIASAPALLEALQLAREFIVPSADAGCPQGECADCDMHRLALRIDALLRPADRRNGHV